MSPATERPSLPHDYFEEIARRAHVYPLPPADFDPLRATEAQLERYGLPARPDEKEEPELFGYWSWLLSQPFDVITPEFPKFGSDLPVVPRYRVGRGGR